METTTETVVPEHYNPNQLVTYKVIEDGITSYPTGKVVDIEWVLENARRLDNQNASYRLAISNLEDMLPGWIENDESAETIVSEICDLFGFNPTKEIEFEATATITGTVTVPLKDMADFDIDSLDLYLSVDSYSYDINADAEVDNITTL